MSFEMELIEAILIAEPMEKSTSSAMEMIGRGVKMLSMSPDNKRITFAVVSSGEVYNQLENQTVLVLEVVKGSLLTFVWNQFARFDEEFALYIASNDIIRSLWNKSNK